MYVRGVIKKKKSAYERARKRTRRDPSIHPSIHLSTHPSIYPPIHPSPFGTYTALPRHQRPPTQAFDNQGEVQLYLFEVRPGPPLPPPTAASPIGPSAFIIIVMERLPASRHLTLRPGHCEVVQSFQPKEVRLPSPVPTPAPAPTPRPAQVGPAEAGAGGGLKLLPSLACLPGVPAPPQHFDPALRQEAAATAAAGGAPGPSPHDAYSPAAHQFAAEVLGGLVKMAAANGSGGGVQAMLGAAAPPWLPPLPPPPPSTAPMFVPMDCWEGVGMGGGLDDAEVVDVEMLQAVFGAEQQQEERQQKMQERE